MLSLITQGHFTHVTSLSPRPHLRQPPDPSGSLPIPLLGNYVMDNYSMMGNYSCPIQILCQPS